MIIFNKWKVMPHNKRQHFVPRSHLKLFTNSDKNSIGVFNKKDEKIIRISSYKEQAYGNYFYTKNVEFEKNLGYVEDYIANLIPRLEIEQKTPLKNTEDYSMLLLNTISQKFRTRKMANRVNELTDKMMKAEFRVMIKNNDPILKNSPEINLESLEKVKFIDNNASLLGLRIGMQAFPAVFDLKCKLLINNSNIPFITSDHPVITYNQFLEKRKFQLGSNGLSTIGLQIFHPLSPKLLLIYFDENVYKVASSKKDEYSTHDQSIINQINLLQIINSENVFYFNEYITDEYILKLFANAKKYLIKEKIVYKEIPQINSNTGEFSELNFFFETPIKTKLNLDFIHEKPHTKYLQIDGQALRKSSLPFSWDQYVKHFL